MARSDGEHAEAPECQVRMPLVRSWSSNLPRGKTVITFDQPGRWMSSGDLQELAHTLGRVAKSSLRELPTHVLFDLQDMRKVFSNRVISIAYDKGDAVGFSEVVYLHHGVDVVMHIGLTVLSKRDERGLHSHLRRNGLVLASVNLQQLKCRVCSLHNSADEIGMVADTYRDVYPHYGLKTTRKQYHMEVARVLLRDFRHECGCSEVATFDDRTFVVFKGRFTGDVVSRDAMQLHKSQECNRFVAGLVDFERGDALLQVGSFSLFESAGWVCTRD